MAHDVSADEDDLGFKVRCTCGYERSSELETGAAFLSLKHRAQAFFADLQAETRRPSFGDRDRDSVKTLLLRAQEAGLYSPPENA